MQKKAVPEAKSAEEKAQSPEGINDKNYYLLKREKVT